MLASNKQISPAYVQNRFTIVWSALLPKTPTASLFSELCETLFLLIILRSACPFPPIPLQSSDMSCARSIVLVAISLALSFSTRAADTTSQAAAKNTSERRYHLYQRLRPADPQHARLLCRLRLPTRGVAASYERNHLRLAPFRSAHPDLLVVAGIPKISPARLCPWRNPLRLLRLKFSSRHRKQRELLHMIDRIKRLENHWRRLRPFSAQYL